MKKHKKRWILLGVLAAALVWWGVGTFTFTVHRVAVSDDKIKSPVTIVQISDLHGASFGKDNEALIRAIRAENPDLICVTGDMYTAGSERGRNTAFHLLTQLAQEYPVYSVNGEHDANDAYMEQLRENGVHVLDYETDRLVIGETVLRVYGISNQYYSSTFDLANEFELDPEAFDLLLAHIPNFTKFARFGMDLTLCGDTHGGQVRLPGLGGLYNDGYWFPEINPAAAEEAAYVKGLYEKGDARMFISSGLGNYPIPLRFLNRPEIAVLTLQPAEH